MRQSAVRHPHGPGDPIHYMLLPYAAAIIVVVSCSVDYFLVRQRIWTFSPTAFALAGFLSIFYVVFLRELLKDRGARMLELLAEMKHILAAYASLAVLSLLYAIHVSNTASGETIFLYAYSLCFLVICPPLLLSSKMGKQITAVFTVALLLYAGSVWFDFLQDGQLTNVEGRAAGFAVNPNTGAFTLVLLVVAAVNWKRLRWTDGLLWSLTAVSVFITFSRGGLLLFILSFMSYLYVVLIYYNPKRIAANLSKMIVLLTVIAAIGWMSLVPLLQESSQFSAYTAQKRLKGLTEVAGSDLSSIREDSRLQLIGHYWDKIKASPLLGHGLGFSNNQPIGSHNVYLSIWTDLGLLGLIAVLYLLSALFIFFWRHRDVRGLLIAVLIALEGFFSHGLLLSRPVLVVAALLCGQAFVQKKRDEVDG